MQSRSSRTFVRVLCNLRWVAVAGQALTVLLVTGWLGIDLPRRELWAGIAALALFNGYAAWRLRGGREPAPHEVFLHMLVDVGVLAWMVGWTGGVENPFSSLFLLPVALSVLALPPRWTWAMAVACVAGFSLSALLAGPLPHVHPELGGAFGLHKIGMLVNFAISLAVLLVFFVRIAAAWRQNEREVASLRESFARNEGIIALATHAASVAHELNTPLATLTLMVDDLAVEADTPARREEYATMRALLAVCSERVRDLARPANAGEGGAGGTADLTQVIERWQLVRPTITLRRSGSTAALDRVDPAVGHLIQALLNNAADASAQSGADEVQLHVQSDGRRLQAAIRDFGRGFGQVQPLLPATLFRSDKPGGLGIGLALSHATVERLGGSLSMQAAPDGPGVVVSFDIPLMATA